MIRRSGTVMVLIFIAACASPVLAQRGESPTRIFGYFQNQFKEEGTPSREQMTNTFLMQQLNMFIQKDLMRKWTSFINFEIVNSYSSKRQWGSFNLEEAWIKYRHNMQFQLKLGLQIPVFNHLNTIKNRTPLLPYVIRPLIYETSLEDMIALEEYVPSRAFVQSYGILPWGAFKFDYALYLGNSPNINVLRDRGQSGTDTTATLLLGGRIGVHTSQLRAGISLAHDKVNFIKNLALSFDLPVDEYTELPRIRLGADASYELGKFLLTGEYVRISYDMPEEINIDKDFYYATLGWRIVDKLLLYGSYWTSRAHDNVKVPTQASYDIHTFINSVRSMSFGASFQLIDTIVMKAQFVRIHRENNSAIVAREHSFSIYSVAASVMF